MSACKPWVFFLTLILSALESTRPVELKLPTAQSIPDLGTRGQQSSGDLSLQNEIKATRRPRSKNHKRKISAVAEGVRFAMKFANQVFLCV